MLIEGLYSVKRFEVSDDKIDAQIHINKDHEVFDGHFPNNPVMPGVCMIMIVKELTEKATSKELFLRKASNIKFMSVINPQSHPDLDMVIQMEKDTESISVKNSCAYDDTTALKMRVTFDIL
ncbi:MAG: 3-hydroxyacyl-ACP dehydratase [Flavobacteriaceae bacterium]|nr:3-hydroxyacyl-ACP dehydratase [Flavobacteriaceae bacterium]